MALSSAARVRAAQQLESFSALERRARALAPGPALRLSSAGFDVIAELKLRSPAEGRLGSESQDWPGRIAAYARGGAAAVSVLTEPSRFDGSLEHLRQAAEVLTPLQVPAMRKDFLVDPYQVLEARAAGAAGILVILRMLPRERVCALMDAAADHGLFVLLEAFDEADLESARQLLASRRRVETLLVGVNSRDLQTLKVVPERFAELAPLLPACACVAESGVASPSDAHAMRRLGYRLALIGTALMNCDDPAAMVAEILEVARTPHR
jgi:indole-3-glycerol phosphate synthase